ncbi:hypothetical protein HW555_000340 [Spodoptera exigua]|uniref:PiggyBac transposable element-derived protein domain-containing protein n=1 Tax=Spodoptera exigua TaxID=7107 RepID=A0A835L8Y7_SPOEX|nr:hypothetical protein HW555_000340 [Spodoptera exigua]
MYNSGPPKKKRRAVGDGSAVPSTSKKHSLAANPQIERQIEEWLAQEDSSGSETEDIPENVVPEQSDHNSETEQSASEDEEANTQSTGQESIQENRPSESDSDDEPLSRLGRCFYGKNRYKWAKDPPNRAVRTGQHNIITRMPESRIHDRNEEDPFSLWKKIITPDILDEILKWTNVKLSELKSKYSRENRPEIQDMDMIELYTFLGLLMYTAVFKSNHENLPLGTRFARPEVKTHLNQFQSTPKYGQTTKSSYTG